MHLKPTNQATQYNLALTHMQAANLVLKKPNASSAELRAAIADLAHGIKCVILLHLYIVSYFIITGGSRTSVRTRRCLDPTRRLLRPSVSLVATSCTSQRRSSWGLRSNANARPLSRLPGPRRRPLHSSQRKSNLQRCMLHGYGNDGFR